MVRWKIPNLKTTDSTQFSSARYRCASASVRGQILAVLFLALASLTIKLHQLDCAVCCTAFRRHGMIPAKAGTTNGLRLFMQFPITRRVSLVCALNCHGGETDSTLKLRHC